MIACIFGAIEPLAKWIPSARYCFASASVILSNHFSFGFPKLIATFSTAVEIKNKSALIALANRLLA